MRVMKMNKYLLPVALFFLVSTNAQETQSLDELNESVGTSTSSIKSSAANQQTINSIEASIASMIAAAANFAGT